MSQLQAVVRHAGRAELAKHGRLLRALVRDEQARQRGALVQGVGLEVYLDRILARDEFVLLEVEGRVCGFCAFYLQDLTLDSAFITLLLLAPEVRGHGLCRSVLAGVAEVASHRGFEYLTLWGRHDRSDTPRLCQHIGFRALASSDSGEVFMRMAITDGPSMAVSGCPVAGTTLKALG